jgi:RimJ/RimL family protein N-acetyltransferase
LLPAVEVGWRLGRSFWGFGYATEAGTAWVRYGFAQLGLERIVSICQPENHASFAVMQRLGFQIERRTVDPKMNVALIVTEIHAPDFGG